MDLEQGVSAGLGVTVDPEGDAVVLVVLGTEEHQMAVPMEPEAAVEFARGLLAMAAEAESLQNELTGLSQEEIHERLLDIQRRYAAPNN